MQKTPVTRDSLQRVAKRVPEIQYFTEPAFALVLRYDACLNAYTPRNHPSQRRWIAPQQRQHVPLEEPEKLRIRNRAVFNYFVQTRSIFSMRQRCQRLEIGDRSARRIERAHQIFAFGQVHAGLASHRAVHLRHQRGGNLHQPHAAKIAGRGETRHVAHYAAANRDDHGAPVRSSPAERATQQFHCCKIFRRFAVVEEKRPVRAHSPNALPERPSPMSPHLR